MIYGPLKFGFGEILLGTVLCSASHSTVITTQEEKKKTSTEGEAVIFFLSVFWWATISSTFVHVLKPFLDASSAGKGAGIGK
jgi:hypothetical protein